MEIRTILVGVDFSAPSEVALEAAIAWAREFGARLRLLHGYELPRPGVAEWWVYPGCDGGRVVADVVRMDKGHTEGLEENVTEQIIQLMMSIGH